MNCPKVEFFNEYDLQENDRQEVFKKFLENVDESTFRGKEAKKQLAFLVSFENIKGCLVNYETTSLLELYGRKINPLRADIRPYLSDSVASLKIATWLISIIAKEDFDIVKEDLDKRLNMYKLFKKVDSVNLAIQFRNSLYNNNQRVKRPVRINNDLDFHAYERYSSNKPISHPLNIPNKHVA